MKTKISLIGCVIFVFALTACAQLTSQPNQTAIPSTVWDGFVSHQPISYGTPLAPAVSSPIDGLYGRLLDTPPEWWRCLRCADYRVVGGLWRLQFDKGVMRIYYEVNGWRSIASFRVEGDRLFIYNDSTCIQNAEYRWHLDQGSLTLAPIGNDNCYFGLRGKNLSTGVWELCPQDRNAADAPLGCGDRQAFQPLEAGDLPVTVQVHPFGSRFLDDTPPSVITAANPENIAPPEGIEITYSPESLGYGANRVLWWGGNWIEAKTSQPFLAIGVQFNGTSSIGWASVFFDGIEVWRGDVSAISNYCCGYGGYIEISGFEPGEHKLRVQLLEGDYRPLTIAMFGFNQ